MKSAAIYARVSSDKQREENTIASQTAALVAFAREQQFDVPQEWVFEDDGYSGAELIRPGLERVRDLAAEGLIQAVLVYAPDRLSRRYAYQILLIEEFARAGVETLFVRAPRGSTPEDELLLQFQGMIAEYERAQILERSRRGKRYRARAGEVSVLSGAPFGYRFIRKTDQSAAYYQIDDEQAQIVQRVFDLYCVEGLSIGAIARRLNEQDIPTAKRRGRWERSVIWGMLRNPVYKGQACFGKTAIAPRQRITRPIRMRGGIASRNSAHHERPREDWITIPVPPIVREEIFALAQERLEANKTHAPRRTVTPSVVQGLVSCAKCGYALYRTSTRSSARAIHYYRCLGSDAWRRLSGSVCNNRPVRQDLLDEVVWTEIMRLLEEPNLIQNELDRRLAAAREADPTKRREETLRRDLARIAKSIDRLLTAYQEGLLSLDELRERMPDLRRREQTANTELQALLDQSVDRATYLRLAETLTTFLTRLRSAANGLDISERQRVVRLLVKEVLVGDDKIIIRHSIPLPTGGDSPSPQRSNAIVPGTGSYLLRSRSHLAATGEPVPALCLRYVDGAGVPAHPVRALRRRRDLSLPYRERGACSMASAGVSIGRLQVDAASGEDENRLLQGCQSEGRLPRHPLRLPGLPIPAPQDDVDGEGQPHLHARLLACGQSDGASAHRAGNSQLGAASPQRQIPERTGRDVQSDHPRLDRLLQPLLPDATAPDA
jgi:site-specific DNA recombinase